MGNRCSTTASSSSACSRCFRTKSKYDPVSGPTTLPDKAHAHRIDQLRKALQAELTVPNIGAGGIIIYEDDHHVFEAYNGSSHDRVKANASTKYRLFSLSHPIIMAACIMVQTTLPLDTTLATLRQQHSSLQTLLESIPNHETVRVQDLLIDPKVVPDVLYSAYHLKVPDNDMYCTHVANPHTRATHTRQVPLNTTGLFIARYQRDNSNMTTGITVDGFTPRYNVTAYEILWAILDCVTGSTARFIQKHIFDSLGMDSAEFTGLDANEVVWRRGTALPRQGEKFPVLDRIGPSQSLICTLPDYVKFIRGYSKLLENRAWLMLNAPWVNEDKRMMVITGVGDHMDGSHEAVSRTQIISAEGGRILMAIAQNMPGENKALLGSVDAFASSVAQKMYRICKESIVLLPAPSKLTMTDYGRASDEGSETVATEEFSLQSAVDWPEIVTP